MKIRILFYAMSCLLFPLAHCMDQQRQANSSAQLSVEKKVCEQAAAGREEANRMLVKKCILRALVIEWREKSEECLSEYEKRHLALSNALYSQLNAFVEEDGDASVEAKEGLDKVAKGHDSRLKELTAKMEKLIQVRQRLCDASVQKLDRLSKWHDSKNKEFVAAQMKLRGEFIQRMAELSQVLLQTGAELTGSGVPLTVHPGSDYKEEIERILQQVKQIDDSVLNFLTKITHMSQNTLACASRLLLSRIDSEFWKVQARSAAAFEESFSSRNDEVQKQDAPEQEEEADDSSEEPSEQDVAQAALQRSWLAPLAWLFFWRRS